MCRPHSAVGDCDDTDRSSSASVPLSDKVMVCPLLRSCRGRWARRQETWIRELVNHAQGQAGIDVLPILPVGRCRSGSVQSHAASGNGGQGDGNALDVAGLPPLRARGLSGQPYLEARVRRCFGRQEVGAGVLSHPIKTARPALHGACRMSRAIGTSLWAASKSTVVRAAGQRVIHRQAAAMLRRRGVCGEDGSASW